jgi:hypothetical protein
MGSKWWLIGMGKIGKKWLPTQEIQQFICHETANLKHALAVRHGNSRPERTEICDPRRVLSRPGDARVDTRDLELLTGAVSSAGPTNFLTIVREFVAMERQAPGQVSRRRVIAATGWMIY